MDVPLPVLGETARAWDEQQLDLTSASRTIGSASAAGFTAAVSGSAGAFTSTWRQRVADLAEGAEARADGLRETAATYLGTDTSAQQDLLLHGIYELR